MNEDALRACLTSIAVALRQCADSLELLANAAASTAVSNQDERWPSVMSTAQATEYCGYKTTSSLRKARLEGRIKPVGRRGGVGCWTWARADLDAFLAGGAARTPASRAEAKSRAAQADAAIRRLNEIVGTKPGLGRKRSPR